jgi:N-acetylgalactosamine-6-sulfatase
MPDWLDPQAVQLPRLFKDAGYKTAHFGKWHLTNKGCDDAPPPTEYGYDESGVFNGNGPGIAASDSSTYDKTIDFIKKHKDSPFFINVWMHETHTPHFPKKQFLKDYEHLDEQHQVYAAIVAEGDHGVGRIMQTLDDLGLADNTLLIFSSDNGPERTGGSKRQRQRVLENGVPVYYTYYSVGSTGGLRARKRSLYEGGVRVPFFVRWPGKVPSGKKNDTTVISAVDLLPTFCKAAGIELPSEYKPDGEDMLDAFLGNEVSRTKPIFWEWKGRRDGDNWPRLGIRDGDWKLVMNYDGSRKELYNIPQDRAEQNNVAKPHPEIVEKLSEEVLTWQKTLPEHPAKHCISKLRK